MLDEIRRAPGRSGTAVGHRVARAIASRAMTGPEAGRVLDAAEARRKELSVLEGSEGTIGFPEGEIPEVPVSEGSWTPGTIITAMASRCLPDEYDHAELQLPPRDRD